MLGPRPRSRVSGHSLGILRYHHRTIPSSLSVCSVWALREATVTDSTLFTQEDVELVQDIGQFCLNVGRVAELEELASLRDRLQQWLDQQTADDDEQRRRRFIEDAMQKAVAEADSAWRAVSQPPLPGKGL